MTSTCVALPVAQRTDGLLVISLPLRDEDVERLSSAAIPVVVIDAHAPAVEGLPHVVGDDIGGGEAAARHLLDLGHRRIAFVGDEFDNPFGFTSSRHRFIGYEQALAAARPGGRARSSWRSARTAATRHVSWPRGSCRSTDRPTAIFAASDTQALGVISAAHEAGLRVPDDLSVVGYDDIEIADYAGSHHRASAAVRVRSARRRAAARRRSGTARRSPPSIVLPPEVVVRGTTAPPKEG